MKTGVFSKRSPDVTVNVHHDDCIVTITIDIGDHVTRDDECEMLTLNNIYIYIFIYIYIYREREREKERKRKRERESKRST